MYSVALLCKSVVPKTLISLFYWWEQLQLQLPAGCSVPGWSSIQGRLVLEDSAIRCHRGMQEGCQCPQSGRAAACHVSSSSGFADQLGLFDQPVFEADDKSWLAFNLRGARSSQMLTELLLPVPSPGQGLLLLTQSCSSPKRSAGPVLAVYPKSGIRTRAQWCLGTAQICRTSAERHSLERCIFPPLALVKTAGIIWG